MRSLFLPVLLLIGALAWGGVVFKRSLDMQAEHARLSQLTADLPKLRARNADLRSRDTLPQEMERLKRDNEDLPKAQQTLEEVRKQKAALEKRLSERHANLMDSEKEKLLEENRRLTGASAAPSAAAGPLAACIGHLKQIQAAKEQWALENKKTAKTVPTVEDLQTYLPKGALDCPSGGTYTMSAIEASPVCSVHGSLPE